MGPDTGRLLNGSRAEGRDAVRWIHWRGQRFLLAASGRLVLGHGGLLLVHPAVQLLDLQFQSRSLPPQLSFAQFELCDFSRRQTLLNDPLNFVFPQIVR